MDKGWEPPRLSGIHMTEPFALGQERRSEIKAMVSDIRATTWTYSPTGKECYHLCLSARGHFGSQQALQDCMARFVVLLIQGLLF